ncbi:MAG: hypothetical protein L0211_11160 [Planctomycetaceae bacterium]|nr:hypothetical protein [Planctomycetaceae bacterium]
MSDSSASAHPGKQPPKSGGSVVRLLVLLGILLLAVGAWYYDYSFAGPGSEQKYEAIQKMVDEKNAKGVKDGGVVTSDDVKAVVGFAPTYVQEEKDHTIEWYCWWGKIPGLSTWKRYITVVYVGQPRHFNTHHKNERPPQESLPNYVAPSTGEDATAAAEKLPGVKGPAAAGEGTDSKAGEGSQEKPAEPASESGTEPKAAESKAEEPKAAEPKAEEPKPETKPEGEKSADAKPADKPAQ